MAVPPCGDCSSPRAPRHGAAGRGRVSERCAFIALANRRARQRRMPGVPPLTSQSADVCSGLNLSLEGKQVINSIIASVGRDPQACELVAPRRTACAESIAGVLPLGGI